MSMAEYGIRCSENRGIHFTSARIKFYTLDAVLPNKTPPDRVTSSENVTDRNHTHLLLVWRMMRNELSDGSMRALSRTVDCKFCSSPDRHSFISKMCLKTNETNLLVGTGQRQGSVLNHSSVNEKHRPSRAETRPLLSRRQQLR
jgi:hypothetical protein